MARKRGGDAGSRERSPGAPRMTGMGLVPRAVLAAVAGAVFGFVGAFAAGGSGGDVTDAQIDALGSALCAALTSPEPEAWATNSGTFRLAYKKVRREYERAGLDWANVPKLPKKSADRLKGTDYKRAERNKKRLQRALDDVSGLGEGIVRGLQIRFTKSDGSLKLNNVSAGAFIPGSARLGSRRRLGNVEVDRLTVENPGGGVFLARVYHRTYLTDAKVNVGEGVVILSESAIEAARGGAGIWLFLTPLLVGLAGFGFVLVASQTASGLQSLARDLDTIGRGRLEIRVHSTATGEIGYVQRVAGKMAQSLAAAGLGGVEVVDASVEKELSLAGQIHENLRPQDPPSISGYEVETLFKSGSDIGGDYFDYIELDESRIALIIADCSENVRGVPAAMIMAMMRAYLKSAIDPEEPPSEWLKRVNRKLARDLKAGMSVTAMIVVLDSHDGQVVAASAGHRPLLVWRKGKTAMINPSGIALGLDIGPVFDKTIEDKRLSLQKNDRLVLYTDGVISAKNADGETYGEERFMESVRKQGGMNSAAFVNFAAGGVDQFLGGLAQDDDITISTIKRLK